MTKVELKSFSNDVAVYAELDDDDEETHRYLYIHADGREVEVDNSSEVPAYYVDGVEIPRPEPPVAPSTVSRSAALAIGAAGGALGVIGTAVVEHFIR